jgi:uncharacterized protein YbjQ (UPF0145 family)
MSQRRPVPARPASALWLSGSTNDVVTDNAWDGRGLPPVARARIARAATDGVRTSLLSVPGAVGLQAGGFEMVGEVLGSTVMQISWAGFGGCGWYGGGYGGGFYGPGTVTSSQSASWSGYAPYVDALKQGRNTAMSRMVQEATALGADGVVGVKLTDTRMDNNKREFVALGTAVRSRGKQRPKTPFTTDLSGQDVTKLLSAGWVPAGMAYGISVAVRHDDWRTRQQIGTWAGNVEVSGYTELISHVRHDARSQFAALAGRIGGDSALMTGMWQHVWEFEAGENHIDHVAECIITGNAIARFDTSAHPPTSSLTYLPLRSSR